MDNELLEGESEAKIGTNEIDFFFGWEERGRKEESTGEN